METFGTECNCYPFEEENMMGVPRRYIKNQHSFGGCYVQYPKNTWIDEETDTTSSSSTSTSESEEETINFPKMKRMTKKNVGWRRHYLPQEVTSTCPEWFTMVDMEGCYPQEVIAKVNTKNRVLLIKAKSCSKMNRNFRMTKEMLLQSGEVVRILPLPENIHIQKLRVKIFPTGEVVVKAPFLKSTESILRQKQILRSLPLWVPIPVIRKETTFNTKRFSTMLRKPTSYYPLNRIHTLGEEQGFYGQDWTLSKLGKKTIPRGHFFPTTTNTTTYGNIFRPEVIRDEITGKLAMLIKVNTLGFLPEEVRVRVNDTENTLIVEAYNKSSVFTTGTWDITKEELLQQGLPVKFLRREFILPQGCIDVNHISYRVKETTGLLVIKVPLLKTSEVSEGLFTSTGFGHNIRGIDNVENMLGQIYHKWEKPLLI